MRLSPRPLPGAPEMIHAPQGRVPTNIASLAPPLPLSRPESRPDFMRGFGVEIPEEEEPEEEDVVPEVAEEDLSETEMAPADVTVTSGEGTEQDGVSTVAQSRIHSRHVSRLSAALSLASVGGAMDAMATEDVIDEEDSILLRSPAGEPDVEDLDDDADVDGEGEVDPDQDAVGEWTGSEDLHGTSDEEVSTLQPL